MLDLKSINKTFNPGTIDEKVLFNGFDLHIDKGEFAAVIGSNGSGKTTLLNIISGSVEPDGGLIILDGEDLSGTKDYKRAKKIGRVFQNPSMGTCSTMTIWENLSIADNKAKPFGLSRGLNRARKDYYRSRLEILGMGLENRLDTLAGALSGGQRQALALIMATLVSPDLLLLDEHTAALDPKAADIVMELTDRVVKDQKITSLMVTHNLRYAVDYGTRTIMMHEGGIVLDVTGGEREGKTIDDYLKIFNSISIEMGN